MSLSSSLYTGTSGLTNSGNALQVTSNNISNVNTVGFKKGETTFADTLYQTVGTQGGASQVGLGMAIGSVSQNFADGSLETTSNATDLAIGGDGFFVVSQAGSDETYYTRAGNFSFDEDGSLVTSGGYIVQGWYLDSDTGDTEGAVTDLMLTAFTSAPEETEEITVITNLDADAVSNSLVLSNVFEYDADEDSTVSSDAYEYQTVLTVYDSLGSSHEVTVYYDKKSDTEWEYIIVSGADEDNRSLVEDTTSQGLLARGTIEFSESSGEITNMTMEAFTGRVGNVETSGSNSVDDIHFEIEDSEAMLVDGYGFEMSYDGDQWTLDEVPDNYGNAEIIYSDDQNIYLVLDPDSSGGDTEADLKIQLDEYAVSGDFLNFDINDTTDLHVQDVEIVSSSLNSAGSDDCEAAMEINDPGVLTQDAEDCTIIWNPATETWQWSNPQDAADAGTLISTDDTYSAMTLDNADALTMTADEVNLRYDATTGEWDWNQTLKEDDFTNLTHNLDEDPTLTIVDDGGLGAIAEDITLDWDSSTSTWSATTTSGNFTVNIDAAESDAGQVEFTIDDGTDTATIQYSLDEELTASDSFTFSIDPTPPEEYADALIDSTTTSTPAIDFDGDGSSDLTIGFTTTPTGGDTFSFSVDPDLPPAEYGSATLTGDDTQVEIDLDGSGDDDDIVITFSESLMSGSDTHPLNDRSSLNFDITGSTAWREVSSEEAEDTGYFQFTADFLGGDFGSTEMDISFNIGTEYDGTNWVNDSLSTTQYARSSSTTYQDSDGYPPGDLTDVEVSSDGTVTGYYSNGQEIPLFMIALADFNNINGLQSEGGNLYSETLSSGSAITNQPGLNGLGELSSYSLEMSNVDISEEFVSMIELQSAYEANAQIISTVDEMMSTVIQMKR